MRELERDSLPPNHATIVIVGSGRVGGSLARAASEAGMAVLTADRDGIADACRASEVALLCVPDDAIEQVCLQVASARPMPAFVGHVSGATSLDALAAAAQAGAATFSAHPLQTFPDDATRVEGASCAVSGSSPKALALATDLAERLSMRPFEVPEENRAAYHAAAAIASNLLVALEESAAELLARAGVEDARELLAPLVLQTAANWSERGPAALTGPIARGDSATVERHREAIAALAPELLATYEALAERARQVASGGRVAA
jgi:predicted short-subunit dehydrogenase-like oxidoreductase (DUF2520 family)